MPFWKSTKKSRTKSCVSRQEGSDFLPGESSSLIKPKNLLIQQILGEGWYGTVEKGQWNRAGNKLEDVLIISVPRNAQGEVLLNVNEMLLLIHPHIVILFGMSLPDPQLGLPLRLVTEYGRLGTLLKNLKEKNRDICTVLSFHCYSVQIASGMEYLSKNNIVQEDLGAHNILVFEPDKIKITGFGLKQLYKNTSDLKKADGPVTWNPPEVCTKREYSSASDVWSFGMLLWVIFSFGSSPLDDLNDKEKSALSSEEPSQKLSCPQACPHQIYHLITRCWEQKPSSRPTFLDLHSQLSEFKLVQVKAISGCKVYRPDHLNYNAGDKITLISSCSYQKDLWFGQLQDSGSLGLFEARNVKVIEEQPSRISEPFNFFRRKREDVFKELNLDEKTTPRRFENPNYEEESPYVDMDNGKVDGKSTSYKTSITSEYELPDCKAIQKSKSETENCLYQVPLKLLTDSDSSTLKEIKLSANTLRSQELPVDNYVTGGAFSTPEVKDSLPAKLWQKNECCPPEVPERADLIEKFETRFEQRALTSPLGKMSTTLVKKRPVPTPRSSRIKSCPPIEMERGSTVYKGVLDEQDRTPRPWNQLTMFKNETGDDSENLNEGDPCFNKKNQLFEAANDRKLFDSERPWNESRPLPDGSDIPDYEKIAELISFADVENFQTPPANDDEVDPSEHDDTPPPLPPKDILSRSYTGFETLLQPSSSGKSFSGLSHRDSYPGMEEQSSNELPVAHIQGMQNFGSSIGIVRRSTPMPISPMAQTPSQSGVTRKGSSELYRPLPPVPVSSMPETRANAISLEQFSSSSAPNDASSIPSLPTYEQPVYDFLLPPVPLPPTIPRNILDQSPPDYLPSNRNTSNLHKETGKSIANNDGTSTDVNANVVSASDSEPSVLSIEELKQKYGTYAKAVEEIHTEFPYEYDTCHAWLVSYEGDKHKVLRFFKINMLMNFTCKSEEECRRALDLYKMDLQRAANHLINSE